MKRRYLILPIFTLTIILIFTILPVSFISANPGNLVENGDFGMGANFWEFSNSTLTDGVALVGSISTSAYVYQKGIPTSNKNLIYSVDVKPVTFGTGNGFDVVFTLYNDGTNKGRGSLNFTSLPLDKWKHISFKLSDAFGGPLPDFDTIAIWLQTWSGCIVYCDNFSLKVPSSGGGKTEQVEKVWVRDREMTCYQVWINESNNFEFVFWWEYKNNNWVKIYDMAGNEVFSIDMEKGNARFEAGLPDGFYTVKTFHNGFETPIQEFVIGKP